MKKHDLTKILKIFDNLHFSAQIFLQLCDSGCNSFLLRTRSLLLHDKYQILSSTNIVVQYNLGGQPNCATNMTNMTNTNTNTRADEDVLGGPDNRMGLLLAPHLHAGPHTFIIPVLHICPIVTLKSSTTKNIGSPQTSMMPEVKIWQTMTPICAFT